MTAKAPIFSLFYFCFPFFSKDDALIFFSPFCEAAWLVSSDRKVSPNRPIRTETTVLVPHGVVAVASAEARSPWIPSL